MNTILSVFYLLPWWLKVFVLLIVIGIPLSIIQKIRETIGGITGRSKIAEQTNSNPELAVQTTVKSLDSGAFSIDEYESHLITIAEKTGCIDAMTKLIELYEGKKFSSKKNDEKCSFWRKRAVKSGDLNSIIDYYGFSEYNVTSDSYDEMISDLKNAKPNSKNEEVFSTYFIGIVYYKAGQINMAKKLFVNLFDNADPVILNSSKYMFFKCLIKEKNMDEAKKISDELESRKFKVPAEDYLNLYNYYYTEKGASKENYEKAILYAVRYAAAENADDNVANEISRNIFYQVAIACQDGINGFDKDKERCIQSYIMAAKAGHVEAMGYLGMRLWVSTHDDMRIYRDYHQANTYLLNAAQKGHKKSKELLGKYGVDGILVIPMSAESVTYRFMDGYKLTVSAQSMKWLQLYKGITYKARIITSDFAVLYKNTLNSFEGMVNRIHALYAEQVAQMLKWGVQVLMFFNIDAYSPNDILNKCKDLSLLPRVPVFVRGLENIDSRAEELNLETAYARASRGVWSGSGFGTTIQGTINASVAAGIMNAGSGILHGIGDSIVDSMNNSEIKGMGSKLFENPSTAREFNQAIYSACIDVGNVILAIIEKHCNIGLDKLEGRITFKNEQLAVIKDGTLNAKIVNNLSIKRYEYTYALLVEKLRRFPVNRETVEALFMLTIQRVSSSNTDAKEIDTLKQYAGDLGLDLSEITNKVVQQTETNGSDQISK